MKKNVYESEKPIKPKIAIIGAGPMGLAVSFELAKNGFKSTIFEADDRLGGMAASFDFAGLEIERYYHFHCLSDYSFFELLKELKLFSQLKWVNTSMGFFYDNFLYKWGSPLAVLKFDKIPFAARIRYLFHAARCIFTKDWRKLDKINAISWLENWLGKKCYEILWSKLFQYKFYNFSDNVSAAWIYSRIRRIGLSRSNFREKLGYLEGGSKRWISALENYLIKKSVTIRLNTAVKEVSKEKNKIFIESDAYGSENFDIVISTIPLPLAGKILKKGGAPNKIVKKYIDQISVACVCVIIETRIPVSKNFWTNINDKRFKIPGIIEFSNLRKLGKNITYIPFYMPREIKEYSDSDNKFIEESIKCLKSINKKLVDSDILNSHCSRYAYAQPVCGKNFKKGLPSINPLENIWTADTTFYYPEDRGISESVNFGRNMAKRIIKNL